MKKRFVVLIDFSDHSESLLNFSYRWAVQTGAELLLVHQVVDPIPGLGEAEILSEMKRDSVEHTLVKLQSIAEKVVGSDVSVTYHTDFYSVSSAVVKLQEPDTIDYLFVGMNDKTGLEKFIMASTALQLTSQVDKIIIALPTAINDFHFDRLYVGIKPSYPLNEARLEELLYITSGKIKHINFFSVLKKGMDSGKVTTYLQSICAKYEKKIPVSYKIVEANDPIVAIKDYMRMNKEVLVIQKGPRNFIDIFRKFFTTEIVYHAQIPVIILP